MKRVLAILMVMLAASMPSLVCCQELTVEECIARALSANSGLKSHAMDISAGEEGRFMAQTAFFPAVKVTGSYTLVDEPDRLVFDQHAFAPNVPAQDLTLYNDSTEFYSLSAIVSQPLFTGGSLTHSYRRAQALRDEAALGYKRWSKDLVRQVKTVFYEAINSRFHAETMRSIAAAKSERLRVLKERVEEGFSLKEDLLRLEGDILLAELEVTRGENRSGRALRKLRNLMEYGGSDDLELKGIPMKGHFTAGLEDVQGEAAQFRDELMMVRKRTEVAQEDVLVARSALFPQISLEGEYTRQTETNFARQEIWSLTAQLDWTIFEWGRTRSDIAQKTALKQRAEYLATEQVKQVMLEVEDAWRGVKEAEQLTVAREHLLKTAEYALQNARERYSEGRSMLADVMEIESEFIAASNDYFTAANEFASALALLEAATGSSLERWVILEERYRPDFDNHARKLQELLQQRGSEKRDKPVDGGAELLPVKPAETAATPVKDFGPAITASVEPEIRPQEPAAAMRITQPTEKQRPVTRSAPSRPVPVDVQLASFKSRQNAEAYRKTCLKKSGPWPVRIISTGGAFKVRVTGFPDVAAAEKMVRIAGINEYLIVRRGSGH